VDAIKGETHYHIQIDGGAIIQTPHDEFEHDYEPVKRERAPKARRKNAHQRAAELLDAAGRKPQ
jgi:hypothetical protein